MTDKHAICEPAVASAKRALRDAIFRTFLDDAARAHEFANWMCIVAELRSRLPDDQVRAVLVKAAASYRAAHGRLSTCTGL